MPGVRGQWLGISDLRFQIGDWRFNNSNIMRNILINSKGFGYIMYTQCMVGVSHVL